MLRREMNVFTLTVCKNEAGRYLESALSAWLEYSDAVFFLDDDSDDNSKEIAGQFEDVIFVEPNFDAGQMWGHEAKYRKALFEFGWANAEVGDILMWEDCDMSPIRDPTDFFETAEDADSFAFYLADLWSTSEQHALGQYARKEFDYRDEPPWWTAHTHPRTWAVRVTDESADEFEWSERGVHCGHLPNNWRTKTKRSNCIVPKTHLIGHWGYHLPEFRQEKFERYESVQGQLSRTEWEHAQTIVDDDPRLRPLRYEIADEFILETP